MWKFEEDTSDPIITADKHIQSCHKDILDCLPETALLFYMGKGVEFTTENYNAYKITESLPTFLNSREVFGFKNKNICFLRGGWGAPMAADTVETLSALGVKNIISVGMFGAFAGNIDFGNIVIPDKAFVEEGTSLHYYHKIEASHPDDNLLQLALKSIINSKSYPIVTSDAVYRQTFYKENVWRNKGAVGVDMETSAFFSVSKYLGVKAASILIASDKHPITHNDDKWQWKLTENDRYEFFDKCINFALDI